MRSAIYATAFLILAAGSADAATTYSTSPCKKPPTGWEVDEPSGVSWKWAKSSTGKPLRDSKMLGYFNGSIVNKTTGAKGWSPSVRMARTGAVCR